MQSPASAGKQVQGKNSVPYLVSPKERKLVDDLRNDGKDFLPFLHISCLTTGGFGLKESQMLGQTCPDGSRAFRVALFFSSFFFSEPRAWLLGSLACFTWFGIWKESSTSPLLSGTV